MPLGCKRCSGAATKKLAVDDDYSLSESLEDFLAATSSTGSSTTIPTAVGRTSADGRQTYSKNVPVEPPSPFKRPRLDSLAEERMDFDDDPPLPTFDIFDAELESERYDMDLGGVYDRPATPPERKKASSKLKPSDKTMHEWRGLRDECLTLLLRLEGAADADLEATSGCYHN
ncbi:hypothetical protein C8F04DRAFT_1256039 [Mycena alexandri]|uniref:Uncharacterized protein n=1 Tax=Mycena alexandri TaxID=1745969 RepID=A0AAD6T4S9_9AGAR|nr:hypothetical protein C8F04DRAFT_1256039 [Mycena alexandri]